ncbi:hypothetical protein ACFL59_03705 [Planctomycetota bacterium]
MGILFTGMELTNCQRQLDIQIAATTRDPATGAETPYQVSQAALADPLNDARLLESINKGTFVPDSRWEWRNFPDDHYVLERDTQGLRLPAHNQFGNVVVAEQHTQTRDFKMRFRCDPRVTDRTPPIPLSYEFRYTWSNDNLYVSNGLSAGSGPGEFSNVKNIEGL